MRKVQKRMSILLAGFLNGFNLFPIATGRQHVSAILGSLDPAIELSTCEKNGFEQDSEALYEDWQHVREDLNNSYNKAKDELEQA